MAEAKVIPMERKKEDLEHRIKDIGVLQSINLINMFSEIEDDKKYNEYANLEILGEVIGGMGQKELFLNSTPARINKELDDYRENKKDDVKTAIERQKEFLFEEYSKGIDKYIEDTIKQFEPKEKVGEEEKKIIELNTEQAIYQALGNLLSGLKLNEDYKDENIKNAYTELKKISKLKDKDIEDYVKDRVVKERKLAYNGRGLTIAADKREFARWKAMYTRDLGKRFVKKTPKGYEVDKDEILKAFGNDESYVKMTGYLSKEFEEMAKGYSIRE